MNIRINSILLLALALCGCSLLPKSNQTTAYKTLATIETTATSAFDGYLTLVAKAKVSTNSVPKIAADFQKLQDALKAATILVQGDTNAVAPASVTVISATLLNEISTAK